MLKGDFSTYPALICPLCNGYQGLSGNGAIKKDTERGKEEERRGEKRKREGGKKGDRELVVGGAGRWRGGRRLGDKEAGRKGIRMS